MNHPKLISIISKGILEIKMAWMRLMLRWALLIAVTVAVTIPLTRVGVPSAALFAALVVGIVLALASAGSQPTTARGRYCRAGRARRLHRHHGSPRRVSARSVRDWSIVIVIAVATLLLSIVAGALLGLHRDVTPLTGALALVAGGASGLVAIARELGGDDRVVSVVQYLRVALVTASMPVVVTLVYHANESHRAAPIAENDSAPWYLSVAMLIALVLVGATVGRLIRLPGAGLLGPMALTVVLELTGLSFGLAVPMVLVQVGYMLIGWQAGRGVHRANRCARSGACCRPRSA